MDCEHCVWAGHYESSETDGFYHRRETVRRQVRRGSTCADSTGVNAMVWNLVVSNFRCCSTNLLRRKLAIPHLVLRSMQQLNYLLPSTLTGTLELSESRKTCRSWYCVHLQENWLEVAEEIDDMFLGDAEVE